MPSVIKITTTPMMSSDLSKRGNASKIKLDVIKSTNKISVYWMHLFMTGRFWAISPPRMMSADCSRSGIRTLSKLSQVIRILCSLQVGTWSAMTGYGLAFPHNSKHKTRFNDMLLEYKENGDLERLSRWAAEYSLKFSSTDFKILASRCVQAKHAGEES